MKIEKMTEELIAYYFGSLSGKPRQNIEEQLITSPQILHEYLALKRSFETLEEEEFYPSQFLQEKIKADIFGKSSFIDFSFLGKNLFTLPRLAVFSSLFLIFVLLFWHKDSHLEHSESLDLQSEIRIDTSSENAVTLNLL